MRCDAQKNNELQVKHYQLIKVQTNDSDNECAIIPSCSALNLPIDLDFSARNKYISKLTSTSVEYVPGQVDSDDEKCKCQYKIIILLILLFLCTFIYTAMYLYRKRINSIK